MATELRQRALRGELADGLLAAAMASWAEPRFKLMVFVSSTFTDTECERNVLLEKILPQLRALGRPHGVEAITFVDMRWGVRDENTLDHQTWVSCKRELERCYNESAGLFFLSLQGDKYGYRPLPRALAKGVLDAALATASAADRSLAEEWYRPDANCHRGDYVLKPLESLGDSGFWNAALPTLRDGCLAGAEFGEGPELLVGQSVTEWEARAALALPGAIERSRWMLRHFDGGVPAALDPKKLLCDDSDRLGALTRHMRDCFAGCPAGIQEASVAAESYLAKDERHKAYMDDFEARASALFHAEVRGLVEAKRAWREDGCSVGLPGEELGEVLHHVQWACAKVRDFEGREAELGQAEAVMRGASAGGGGLSGLALCVVGKSGAGKTAFIAKLAQRLSRERPDRPVLVRFCGTSRGSMAGLVLVQSLCLQMEHVFALPAASPAPSGYAAWVARFHSLLGAHAVTLLVDSLDQLSNDDEARSQLSFLKGVVPHADTRIVVSCLPDETDALTGKRYFYGCDTRLREGNVPRVDILPLEDGDALCMMRQLLARQGRGLTAEQWDSLRLSFSGQKPTALYCRLAVHVAAAWLSGADPAQCLLPPSVPALIDFIFDGLELEFGRPWTRVALALITYSRAGVSDAEMQDLLSLDDEHVLNHVFQYSKPTSVRRFPLHVWLRLRGALEGLLVEREHGCFQWYHRQLKETAEARYAAAEKQLAHSLMARYFADLCGSTGRERCVAAQPLTLNGAAPLSPGAVANRRRCVESPHHLALAGPSLHEHACAALCTAEMVWACAAVGQCFELLRALLALNAATGGKIARVAHYTRWLQQDATHISARPGWHLIGAATGNQPQCSLVRRDVGRLVGDSATRLAFSRLLTSSERAAGRAVLGGEGGEEGGEGGEMGEGGGRRPWVRGVCLGGPRAFSACVATIQGHGGKCLTAAQFTPDKTCAVSASHDETVRVWDVATGEPVACLRGHSAFVTCLAVARHGLVVSGSQDASILVWSLETASCVGRLQGHDEWVAAVALSPCQEFLASGSWDETVKIWHLASCTCLATLSLHSDYVNAVAFSTNARHLVSASNDDTLKVFNWSADAASGGVPSCECIATLVGHTGSVCAVAFSADDTLLVSASADATLRVWLVGPWQCSCTLTGHQLGVASACFCEFRGTLLVASSSHDKSLRLWDAASGACLAVCSGHTNVATQVAASSVAMMHGDNIALLLSSSFDGTLKLWSVEEALALGTVEQESDSHGASVNAVAMLASGDIVTGSDDRTIIVWEGSSHRCMHTLVGHEGKVVCVATSRAPGAAEWILSGGRDKDVKLWRVAAAECLLTCKGHTEDVNSVTFMPCGTRALSGADDSQIRLWDLTCGACLAVLRGHTLPVKSLAVSPDGSWLASGSGDHSIKIWSTSGDWLCRETVLGHENNVVSVAFVPQAASANSPPTLVSGSLDKTVRLWSLRSGAAADGGGVACLCLGVLRGHLDFVKTVSVSADGLVIASAGFDRTIRLWSCPGGRALATLHGHTSHVTSVCWAPRGDGIASAGYDVTARLWDLAEV